MLSNISMFDIENDLPDELMNSTSWNLLDNNMGNSKPPAQGPGPGGMQNGIENTPDGNSLRQMQLIMQQQVILNTIQSTGGHLTKKLLLKQQQQGNKGLVGNTLAMAANQLGSKSPNLQSPPNVSVAKANVVDQMNMGSLPSSISNNSGLQSIANNGSSPQVMSSIQGINNSGGGGMIMTNSNINAIGTGSIGGGGLVVSTSVNKPLTNAVAPNMLAPGQPPHHVNQNMPQVCIFFFFFYVAIKTNF